MLEILYRNITGAAAKEVLIPISLWVAIVTAYFGWQANRNSKEKNSRTRRSLHSKLKMYNDHIFRAKSFSGSHYIWDEYKLSQEEFELLCSLPTLKMKSFAGHSDFYFFRDLPELLASWFNGEMTVKFFVPEERVQAREYRERHSRLRFLLKRAIEIT
jgi:hypothetical protein